MRIVGITTVDNPFNPIDDFDNWWVFDREHNYATCELLDRFVVPTYRATEAQTNYAIEQAIDSIVELHPFLYKKVTKETI